ncbi:calcium activated cation channel [Pseudohyphozyma bogoriensis]|nr:calcium activated cation channel [Pseudohyphozyma bogoriensis]
MQLSFNSSSFPEPPQELPLNPPAILLIPLAVTLLLLALSAVLLLRHLREPSKLKPLEWIPLCHLGEDSVDGDGALVMLKTELHQGLMAKKSPEWHFFSAAAFWVLSAASFLSLFTLLHSVPLLSSTRSYEPPTTLTSPLLSGKLSTTLSLAFPFLTGIMLLSGFGLLEASEWEVSSLRTEMALRVAVVAVLVVCAVLVELKGRWRLWWLIMNADSEERFTRRRRDSGASSEKVFIHPDHNYPAFDNKPNSSFGHTQPHGVFLPALPKHPQPIQHRAHSQHSATSSYSSTCFEDLQPDYPPPDFRSLSRASSTAQSHQSQPSLFTPSLSSHCWPEDVPILGPDDEIAPTPHGGVICLPARAFLSKKSRSGLKRSSEMKRGGKGCSGSRGSGRSWDGSGSGSGDGSRTLCGGSYYSTTSSLGHGTYDMSEARPLQRAFSATSYLSTSSLASSDVSSKWSQAYVGPSAEALRALRDGRSKDFVAIVGGLLVYGAVLAVQALEVGSAWSERRLGTFVIVLNHLVPSIGCLVVLSVQMCRGIEQKGERQSKTWRASQSALSTGLLPAILSKTNLKDEAAPLLDNNLDDPRPAPHPKTVARLIKRIRALTMELLPIQVDPDELMSPTSSIITAEVVESYSKIGGSFQHVVPFALLEARRYFRAMAYLNPSDSDENNGRKLACEVIARKLVAKTPMQEQYSLLSKRYTRIETLESATDQKATFFLSSNEAQRCVFALWRGLIVQTMREDGTIEYVPYEGAKINGSTFSRFDPNRIGVPRYQFFFRIALWIVFVAAYTWSIQSPERGFGFEDVLLYIQLLGYMVEDFTKMYKIGIVPCLSFWTCINFCIYALLTTAFVYRVLDVTAHDVEKSDRMRLLSFQFMSSAAPLVWAKLVTIFDLYQFFGTLQIVMNRMLKESAVFFTLLAVLAAGFGQALTGLDVADSTRDSTESVMHSLIQGLLGSPAFDLYDRDSSSYPFGMILYYFWSTLTLVILLNILVALFGSAYSDCTDEAVPTFMGFFAAKTIDMVRAPDNFVFVAPFNLVELPILPFEYILSKERYATLNRYLMGTVFFIPLDFASLTSEVDEYTEEDEDPKACSDEPDGMEISKVSFEELKKSLPSLTRSVSGEILWTLKNLAKEVEQLKKEVKEAKKE